MSRLSARIFLLLLCLLPLGSCRRILNPGELRTATAPHVSRVLLKDGHEVDFNDDLGWFDARDSTIEGVTVDSQEVHVSIHDVNRVETVREYSIVFVYAIALGIAGVVSYAFFKLFELL